jgi:hypothetical protein
LTPAGKKRSLETPQAPNAPRRLQDLPAESKFPQRKFTGYNQKQQYMRKQLDKRIEDDVIKGHLYLNSYSL